jgi:ATPase subunit of ABC transporter with duplicated ATPase domains
MKLLAATLLPRTDLKVCYMPQNYEDQLDLSLSPLEWLSITGDKEETTKIRTYLGSMRYTPDEMFHPMRELSGGQKAKILFLKMILSGANVLLLDEPTRNFSPLSNPVIRQVLKEFGGSIISISHDRKYIEEVADTVYELTPRGLVKKY